MRVVGVPRNSGELFEGTVIDFVFELSMALSDERIPKRIIKYKAARPAYAFAITVARRLKRIACLLVRLAKRPTITP
jgi:hypothetical protein